MKRYKIVRMYKNRGPEQLNGNPFRFLFQDRQTIKEGLTLKQAQKHCQDKETSSSTCTNPEGIERTEKCGDWFDGYEEE